ncbi:MAG: ACT domain-containing protein [Clostridia bacterium]
MNHEGTAVVTVLGRDCKGIIARVSGVLYAHDVNILDISQTVLSGLFNMVMLVDISAPALDFTTLREALCALGTELGLQVRIQRSEIFDAMHRV